MSKTCHTYTTPQVTLTKKEDQSSLVFSGEWLTLTLASVLNTLRQLKADLSQQSHLTIQFERDFSCDTAGAWAIAKFLDKIKLSPVQKKQIPAIISGYLDKDFKFPPEPDSISITGILEEIGRSVVNFGQSGRDTVGFLGQTVTNAYNIIVYKYGFRWTTVAYFIDMAGLRAVPIVSLISLLIGAVLAYQGVSQLERFGASSFTVDFLAISLLREISVLLTSIVVAGRSGSSFAAQIGTMSLNQEIDAIRMMGLNPFHVLVIPRVIALMISLPLLVLVSILLGGIGGMIVVNNTVGISYGEFWSLFQGAVQKTTFWTGMSKAPLFALIIAVIGCYRGMQVKGSAESVGIMTTRSVVEAIFMVIVCDAVMSIFFTIMDW